jgi:Phage integrase family
MPVKLRSSDLETATSRLKLKPRKAPYRLRVASGVALAYRRTQDTFGSWSAVVADGSGNEQLKKFGNADDREPANNKTVLSFDQAMTQARLLARGEDEAEQTQSLTTVETALASYKIDLMARSADTYNADRPLYHLGPALLRKPTALVSADDLTAWRNGLVRKAELAPSSINRLMNDLRAALTHADPKRAHIWREGLKRLPNAEKSRNKVFTLDDATICALVAKAYARDEKLGLLFEVLSETGTRPVQAARLKAGYLVAHPTAPKLLVSKSAKGGGRNRTEKKRETYSLPISIALAKKLKRAAAGRAEDDRLLLRADGQPWNEKNVHGDYRVAFAEIVKAMGLNPKISGYCFRHSSICRQLMRGVPTRVVAANHDTSVSMLEKNYSRHIVDHSDEITRAALLDHQPAPVADNIVALAG